MDSGDKDLYNHMLIQYRKDVDILKWSLARANAQLAAKDQIIRDLTGALEEQPTSPEVSPVPKPGPRTSAKP